MAYLSFCLESIPDLSLSKYSSLDESGVDGVLTKTGSFLRQINRKGILSKVFFHLLYTYVPEEANGQRLKVSFIASGAEEMLLHTRELVHNSAISAFYDIKSVERVSIAEIEKNKNGLQSVTLRNHLGHESRYASAKVKNARMLSGLTDFKKKHFTAIVNRGTVTLQEDGVIDESGLLMNDRAYSFVAALGKREFFVEPSVILPDDNDLKYYKVAEWEMNEGARLYNMFRLMQGLNKPVTFRLDIFSVDYTASLRNVMPIQELRHRTSFQITKSAATLTANRDENAEETLKQYSEIIEKYESAPHFRANILSFADERDVAELIVDAAGAEALESGSYSIKLLSADDFEGRLSVYTSMDRPVAIARDDAAHNLKFMPNLFLLDELRPFFSFPALHDGEVIEIPKETAPVLNERGLDLGVDENGYNVVLPVALLKKHAFLAGVPGSGKTNSMLHLASSLWKTHGVPFLILEPAKKEYRALARTDGMDDLYIFSPSSGTRFPLHINPFEFPCGMSLSEHIRNLMAVFEGAFPLTPPAPFLIDIAIEAVYRDKGWYPDTINEAKLPYPTMSELYSKLAEEVEQTDYGPEIKGNLKSILQVRVGSLLRREMGDVFDVAKSTLPPEEWLDVPALIELEAMGPGPANFLTLLLATLIRESLKVKPSVEGRELRHVIFFEEAHNLIGPEASEITGEDADPKLAATAYIVKMLAEVRALNEGIIIADQLPTVMAPEVIKNTGLKIGHRLTAEDDRNLLGGTMSANGIQLEQMATFLPGEALVTFEGQLRPFKAQIRQWENGTASYESPSNEELVDVLLEKKGYKALLNRSAQITSLKFSFLRQKIMGEVLSFIDDNNKLGSGVADLDAFEKAHDISDEMFFDIGTENPLAKKAQEMASGIAAKNQELNERLEALFSSINELLVMMKGYLLQNKLYRKDTAMMLLELHDCREMLFKSVSAKYKSCVAGYEAFSKEMSQWNLNAVLADVDL